MNLVTVTDLRRYAPDLDLTRYDNTGLEGFLASAQIMAEDYLGYTILAEDITDETKNGLITSEGDLLIYPSKVPIISVSKIEIIKGGVSVDLLLTTGSNARYNLDFTKRHIRYPYFEAAYSGSTVLENFYALRGTQFYVRMSYRAGYEEADIPAVIKQAIILYVREFIAKAANSTGAVRISQGGISLQYAEKKGKSDLVVDAERLLTSYRRLQ